MSTQQSNARLITNYAPLASIVIAGFLCGTLAATVLIAWDQDNPFLDAQLAYFIPALIALANIAATVAKHRWLGIAHPVTMLTLGLLVFLSTGPLLNPANSTTAEGLYQSPDRYWPLVSTYTLALALLALGSTIARLMRIRLSPRASSLYYFDARRLFVGLLLCAISVTALLFLLATLNRTGIGTYFDSVYMGASSVGFQHPDSTMLYLLLRFILVAIPVLCAIAYSLSAGRRYIQVVSALLLALSLYFQFAAGTRYFLVYAAGGAILVWFGLAFRGVRWWTARIRVNTRLLLSLLLVLIMALAVFQMGYVRIRGGVSSLATGSFALPSIQTFVDYGIDTNPPLEEMLTIVPERRPFIYGESFLSAFVAFVPRSLWTDKPKTAWAYMEGHTTMPELVANPNAAWTIIGELYLNFGLFGVALGMLIIGFMGELWAKRYRALSASPSATTFYFMTLPAFAFLARGDFQAAAGTIIYPMIIVYLVLRLSRSRTGSRLESAV